MHIVDEEMASIEDLIKDKAAKRLEMETCVRIETEAQFFKLGEFVVIAAPANEPEPFYIADRYYDICIEAAANLHNEFYANRRLRKYEILNNDMSLLPQQSLGMVYCFNEFTIANEDYIIDISKQVYDLLYDGGNWIFNFLPNDKIWAQKANIENNLSVIDYKLVIEKLTLMGFILESFEIKPLKSSYMVWRKNGELQPRYKIGGGTAEIIDL